MPNTLKHAEIGEIDAPRHRIVISPVNLTANGRAHLGHAGGPFLRMDILARALRRSGHDVWTGLTTDGFENHVVSKAHQLGEDPAAMAARFHEEIREDLGALDIRLDCFDDPVSQNNIDTFFDTKAILMKLLEESGQIELRHELLPVDDALPESEPVEDRFAIGAWFAAHCPSCHAASGNFFCEACGAHFEPYEAEKPASRRGKIVDWTKNRSHFLHLQNANLLTEQWRRMRVEAPFLQIARRHVDQRGAVMRLTLPGRYGIPWQSGSYINRQILFSYSASCYTHHLYCGERYASERGGPNAFAAESDTFLIGSTGIDNTVPVLVGVTGCALSQSAYRPFDRMCFNYFLKLNGSKFSTSRGHVIWASDIAAIDGIAIDALRVYLSEICPEEGETDLRIADMLVRHNTIIDIVAQRVERACATLASGDAAFRQSPVFDPALVDQITECYFEQSEALSPDLVRVSRAAKPLMTWLSAPYHSSSPQQAYSWLKGLAFLAAPLMPGTADAIWKWLGHVDSPTAQTFKATPSIQSIARPALPLARALCASDLSSCIPSTVTL